MKNQYEAKIRILEEKLAMGSTTEPAAVPTVKVEPKLKISKVEEPKPASKVFGLKKPRTLRIEKVEVPEVKTATKATIKAVNESVQETKLSKEADNDAMTTENPTSNETESKDSDESVNSKEISNDCEEESEKDE